LAWNGRDDYVASCPNCQLTGPKRITTSTPKLTPIAPPANVWSLVGIDLMGPYEETKTGNTHVLVVKCYLSKYAVVRPILDKKANTVALETYKIYCEYGFVEAIISDQGKEFVGKVILILNTFVFFD
jgi:hypothetical protein